MAILGGTVQWIVVGIILLAVVGIVIWRTAKRPKGGGGCNCGCGCGQ